MRLLERNNVGEFSLTKDFCNHVSRYAILSHTWGLDTEGATDLFTADSAAKDSLKPARSPSCAGNRSLQLWRVPLS
jgi:hypothetical protein